MEGFRASGDEVVEANAPLGFSTAERVAMLSKPWRSYRLMLRLVRRWASVLSQAIRLRRQGGIDAVLIGYLGHFDVVLARLLFPRGIIVLDMLIFAVDTARDRRTKGRPVLLVLAALDGLAAWCATVIVVDTDEHLALLSRRHRRKGLVAAVGAPSAWFRVDPVLPRDPSAPLRVVFFGLFTPLQGAPVIGRALGLLAHDDRITTTMIGTGQDLAATRKAAADNPNIAWLDWMDNQTLLDAVAQHDICLGIFGSSPKALRVVPNKVFQGAAAGAAIVTSDTPAQRRALGSDAIFVPPGDARSLANALIAMADNRPQLESLRSRSILRARRAFTPAEVVAPLRTKIVTELRQVSR